MIVHQRGVVHPPIHYAMKRVYGSVYSVNRYTLMNYDIMTINSETVIGISKNDGVNGR
jgi:hypothetical protein